MKKIKLSTILQAAATSVFCILALTGTAQQAKREIKSYDPKSGNKGDNIYWTANDTLFACQMNTGQKVAIADIDFSKEEFTKTGMKQEVTDYDLYSITLYLIKGKKSYTCGCAGAELTGKPRPGTTPVKIIENSAEMADIEFSRLRLDDLNKKIGPMQADTVKPVTPNAAPANDAPMPTDPSTATPGGFDDRLLALINGFKDDFAGIKGDPIPGSRSFMASISLDGALNTTINSDASGHLSVVAGYGEFNTLEAALTVYKKVSDQVDSTKKMPAMMIKQAENASEAVRINSWIPFGDLDPGLKGFKILVELLPSAKFDKKTFIKTDIYYVSLTIDK